MQKINNRQALLGFSFFAKIGPQKIIILEKYFSNFYSAFWANADSLRLSGLNSKLIDEFIIWRNKFNFSTTENFLEKESIAYVTLIDSSYPSILKEISLPPFILFYKGNLNILTDQSSNKLAIVGSRKHSTYANKIITEFIPALVSNNIIIISGLALGVDTLAHQETLNNKGQTIAVLGSGLDKKNFYPLNNYLLGKRIIANNGLIISEFSPGTPPLGQNFPRRNRIISGLAQATLVIEAKEKSGSLITANFALDQNREVLAIPGNIFSESSAGTNNLIKAGAKLINEPNDILEIYKIPFKVNNSMAKKKNIRKEIVLNTTSEKLVYEIIKQAQEKSEKIYIDEIIKETKLDTAVINSTLSILELRGLVKNNETSYEII